MHWMGKHSESYYYNFVTLWQIKLKENSKRTKESAFICFSVEESDISVKWIFNFGNIGFPFIRRYLSCTVKEFLNFRNQFFILLQIFSNSHIQSFKNLDYFIFENTLNKFHESFVAFCKSNGDNCTTKLCKA